MQRKWTAWPLAPLFLGAYPVLHLYSLNMEWLDLRVLQNPLLIGLSGAAALTLITALASRSLTRGALLASALLFSSYLVCSLADVVFPWDNAALRHRDIILTLLPLGGVACAFILERKTHDAVHLLMVTNLTSLILVLLPTVHIAIQKNLIAELNPIAPPARAAVAPAPKILPDIYYIILDGYASGEVLRRDMGYDNRAFLSTLRSRGFYVADQSRSNYAYTYLSLASSLNMDYLNGLSGAAGQRPECLRRISDNRVFLMLKAKGYRIEHFSSGWSVTDYNKHADVVINPRHLNEFQGLLLRASILRIFWKPSMMHAGRERVLSTLEELESLAPSSVPRFTFVHLISPHPPYLFDRHGDLPLRQNYTDRPPGSHDWHPKQQYVEQVDYLNSRVLPVVDHLLKISPRAVIILQGDHGAACDGTAAHPTPLMVHERMGILNAYYGPPAMIRALYPSISPVNSFRVVLDTLFGMHLPLLRDVNYYSGPMDATPYIFRDVTARPV